MCWFTKHIYPLSDVKTTVSMKARDLNFVSEILWHLDRLFRPYQKMWRKWPVASFSDKPKIKACVEPQNGNFEKKAVDNEAVNAERKDIKI